MAARIPTTTTRQQPPKVSSMAPWDEQWIQWPVKDNISDSKPTVQGIMKELQASLDESARERELMEQSLLESTDAMLQGAFGRAMRTMSTKAGPTIEDISIMSENNHKGEIPESEVTAERTSSWRPAQEPDAYLLNPAINPTALAHHMWSHALRPNIDTAIDATCGNGNDSVAIASMLFNDNDNDRSDSNRPTTTLY